MIWVKLFYLPGQSLQLDNRNNKTDTQNAKKVNALRKIQIKNNLNIQRQKQREKQKLVVTVRNFLNKEVFKINFNVF